MTLKPAEELSISTVRIVTTYSDGTKSVGTGFIYTFFEDNKDIKPIPVIVTNKHVIKDGIKCNFAFTLSDKNDELINPYKLDYVLTGDMNNLWSMHDEDDVDLCVFPMGDVLNKIALSGKKIFYGSFGKRLIPKADDLNYLDAIEDVVMIGYPNGLWDEYNNKPIFRKGITATHPKDDYNNRKEILIDISCYPGSSGSPVFIYEKIKKVNNNGEVHEILRALLIGVLYAGKTYTVDGKVKGLPPDTVLLTEAEHLINLGIILKAERITEIEKQVEKQIINSRVK